MIEFLEQVYSWLFSIRTNDSAIWAVAFTLNTWASSIDEIRTDVYKWVFDKFQSYRKRAIDGQWLSQIEACPDSENKAVFLRRLDNLRTYFKRRLDVFSAAKEKDGSKAKKIMSFSAFLCVLCILFEWYYNVALVLLLPYPMFRAWNWFRICKERIVLFVKEKKVDRARHKACSKKTPPPTVDDLRDEFGD